MADESGAASVAESNVAPSEGSALKSFISGGFGGTCLVFVGHPFDLVKVRLQTMQVAPGQAPPYKSALDCAAKTLKREGPRGLYRGMATPLVGVTPIFAVCFWGYDVGKKIQMSMFGIEKESDLSIGQIAMAGAFSAVPTTAIMAPGERIKCILQIQGQEAGAAKPKYNGPWDVVKQLYKEGGIRSVYKGTYATLLRDGLGSLAYFGVYEGLKRYLTPAGSSPDELSPFAVFMAGGFAGIFNWVIAIAPDTVKSRLQTAPEGKYRGMVHVFKTMVREEGVASLYKGVGPAMARAFPANAACFLGMEYSRKALDYLGM